MDEATKTALNAALQQAIAAAQNASTWTSGQVPELVAEWLRWQMFSSLFFAGIGLCIMLLVVWALRKVDDWTEDALFCFMFLGGAVLTVVNLYSAMQVWVAPRVVIVEKLMELVKR
jgi:hypothetical protein